MATTSDGHLKYIKLIAQEDAAGLFMAHKSYGSSWKKRGGIGAYMVMIRKFDRIKRQVKRYGYDVVKAVEADLGLIDDIRDARRYLMLIESWLREMCLVKAGDHRDNLPERKFAENVNDQLGTFSEQDVDNKFDNHCNFGGVSRSYSDLDIDMSDMLEHDPKCVAGDAMLRTDRVQQPIKIMQLKCIAHIPDAICECSRCQAMAKLAKQPHIKDCRCENCVVVKRTMDRIKSGRRHAERRRGKLIEEGLVERAHLAMVLSGGLCEICGDRNDPSCDHCDITKQAETEAKKRLYEDNPHPLQCGCDMCLAEHDGPCSHDCEHPICKKARGDQNG